MGSLLGCLFTLVLAVFAFVLVGLARIAGRVRSIFSQFSQGGARQSARSAGKGRQTGGKAGNDPSSSHRKVFDDNEGEYVDFEEIK